MTLSVHSRLAFTIGHIAGALALVFFTISRMFFLSASQPLPKPLRLTALAKMRLANAIKNVVRLSVSSSSVLWSLWRVMGARGAGWGVLVVRGGCTRPRRR